MQKMPWMGRWVLLSGNHAHELFWCSFAASFFPCTSFSFPWYEGIHKRQIIGTCSQLRRISLAGIFRSTSADKLCSWQGSRSACCSPSPSQPVNYDKFFDLFFKKSDRSWTVIAWSHIYLWPYECGGSLVILKQIFLVDMLNSVRLESKWWLMSLWISDNLLP